MNGKLKAILIACITLGTFFLLVGAYLWTLSVVYAAPHETPYMNMANGLAALLLFGIEAVCVINIAVWLFKKVIE